MIWILDVAHTLRLLHIDLLDEMLVRKDVINIKLAKAPRAMECNAEHSMKGDGIDHGTRSLVKMYTWLLVKAFNNKPSFIPNNRAIVILFDAKKTHLLVTMFCPKLEGRETKCHSE